jgi:hypothetical protein
MEGVIISMFQWRYSKCNLVVYWRVSMLCYLLP